MTAILTRLTGGELESMCELDSGGGDAELLGLIHSRIVIY
jgi:hypothetical protein